MADEVKLHGNWLSPFSSRVIWALKLKGIPYEYVEENVADKSALLLHYNPVYKKIPVLVHGRKPICESMIILDYIDETWPENPLLPSDPFERATARFWIKFIEDKVYFLDHIIKFNLYLFCFVVYFILFYLNIFDIFYIFFNKYWTFNLISNSHSLTLIN